MFADFMKGCTDVPIGYPIRHSLAKDHYKIRLNDPKCVKEIAYEKFDYNIIKPNINPFADTLVNEMWPFCRMLWKTRGGYTAEVKFNPEIDLKELGSQFGPGMYNAVYKFTITDAGEWDADFDIHFSQIDNNFDDREPPPIGRKGPFYAQDYSRIQANTAKRARKLAKPTWDVDEGRSGSDFMDLLNEEQLLNETIDFSFKLHWIESGDWGDYSKYEVQVSDTTSVIIPEKDAMTAKEFVTIDVTTIKKLNQST